MLCRLPVVSRARQDGRVVPLRVLGLTLAALTVACSVAAPPPPAPTFGSVRAALGSGSTAWQDGVAPTASYAGTRDTTLSEAPSAPLGTTTPLSADGDDPAGSNQRKVALLAWQLTDVPAGAQVTAARLVVEVVSSTANTYNLYRVLRPWGESTATWTAATGTSTWQQAGAAGAADRDGTVLAVVGPTSRGVKTFVLNAAGVAAVQQWLDDPSSNHGLVLVGSGSDGVDLVSREGSLASRPRLEIDWQVSGADAASPDAASPDAGAGPDTGGSGEPVAETLIPAGSTWRYRDNGQDPGPTWTQVSHDDGAWPTGPAKLGYGNGDEATVIGYGPSATSKYLTAWFRHGFQVSAPGQWQSLLVRLRCDDGAAVYLNGIEILRSNLPIGTLSPTTRASSNGSDQVWVEAAVDPGLLLAGQNVLAAEVHQVSGSSSDLGFVLELTGLRTSGPACVEGGCDDGNVCTDDLCDLAIGCQHPPSGVTTCDDGNACTSTSTCSSGSCVGQPLSCDDGNACTVDGCAPATGCHHQAAVCDDGDPCTQDGCSPASGCTFTAVPDCTSEPAQPVLIQQGATWRYLANGSDQGSAWRSLAFNDGKWPSGPAMLGYNYDEVITTVPYGSSSNKYITTYFRHTFTVDDPNAYWKLTLRLWRDDGAVVYLNGQEVFRDNLPDGPIGYKTLAVVSTKGSEPVLADLSPAGLVAGKNVVAVEMHQASPSSSDLAMDLDLRVACQKKEAVETLCNGKDDDCDGVTDVLLPLSANTCLVTAKGACAQGMAACIDGQRTCLAPPPVAEVVNGQDDDCDGQTDEATASTARPVRVRVLLPPTLDMAYVHGMVEALETVGVPYDAVASSTQRSADWSNGFANLAAYTVVVVPGQVSNADFSSTQLAQVKAWVEAGGVLVLLKPSGNAVLGLAGATSASTWGHVMDLRVLPTAPAALYLDAREERDLLVSEDTTARATVLTYGLDAASGVVAFATARSQGSTVGPAWLRRPLGAGAVYALGLDPLEKRDMHCYASCFDPARDVMAQLLRAIVREASRGHYVRKHTVPGTESTVVLLSHDIDATKAWQPDPERGEAGVLQMAKMEVAHGVPASFFLTTDPDYYVPSVIDELCKLGMCPAGGHSMLHLDMSTLSVGSCSVKAANYDLNKPTLCGEIVVNRELVLAREPAGSKMLAWRSPFLAVHPDLYDILYGQGFLYDSSLALGDLRTNFPVMVARFPYKQDVFRGRPMVSFPVCQSDSLRVSNKGEKLHGWINALVHNLGNGAWNTLLVHPSAGDGMAESFFVKIQAVQEFIEIAQTMDVRFEPMVTAGEFWRARDAVRLSAQWVPATGYSGAIQVGALPAPRFSLEFGDVLKSFNCPGAGPFTVAGRRVVFTQPLPAGQKLTFTATVL